MTRSNELVAQDILLRGVRIRYYEAGEGQCLLLVHGFLEHHACWRLVVPRLARRFRVIAPDLPGSGDSEKPWRYPYTRDAFSETLCDLLAGLDISRTHLVGHSLGGAIALTLAADHPEHIDRLALLSSVAFPTPLPFKARLLKTPGLGQLVFKQLYRRSMFRSIFTRDAIAAESALDPRQIDEFYDSFNHPDAREAAWRTLQSSFDPSALIPRIQKVRAPTMVLWGERDRILPMELGRQLARELSNSTFEVLPGVGHLPHEEEPEATAALIEQHLSNSRLSLCPSAEP